MDLRDANPAWDELTRTPGTSTGAGWHFRTGVNWGDSSSFSGAKSVCSVYSMGCQGISWLWPWIFLAFMDQTLSQECCTAPASQLGPKEQ